MASGTLLRSQAFVLGWIASLSLASLACLWSTAAWMQPPPGAALAPGWRRGVAGVRIGAGGDDETHIDFPEHEKVGNVLKGFEHAKDIMKGTAEDTSRALAASANTSTGAITRRPVDAGGDDCSWYSNRTHLCGCCDDEDFVAANCSECAGAGAATSLCQDTDGGAATGNPCSYMRPEWCGYSAHWFISMEMCCLCGGGQWPALEVLDDRLHRFPAKTTRLALASSRLNGSIPDDLPTRFPLLTDLDLSGNEIDGGIPASLWQLPRLRRLQLQGNRLNGSLTADVGAAGQLRLLDLSDNQLSGPLPEAVGGWTSIQYVKLGSNAFAGPLPDAVRHWTSVMSVDLSRNQLTSLTEAIGNWSKAIYVSFNSNFLAGRIPRAVASWTQVETVDLGYNAFSGTIPEAVGTWTRVERVSLGDNALSGAVPEAIGAWRDVRFVDLQSNTLSGPIPASVSNWSRVERVNLSSNALSGAIPEAVGAWGLVRLVYLLGNELSGSIPPTVANWSRVERVRLDDNALSGAIPDAVGAWSRLLIVNMRGNKLSGAIPPAVANWTQAKVIDLSENVLSGAIPEAVGAWDPWLVGLGDNKLSGPIPPGVANWAGVEYVILENNSLSGAVPEAVGAWGRLRHLRCQNNQLSGPIPLGVVNWTQVLTVMLQGNAFSGIIPEAVSAWRAVRHVELSSNRLSGPIPRAVASWTQIQVVGLNDNALSGVIPETVSAWSRVREIHLGKNNLSGHVPTIQFPELIKLRLDRNALEGFVSLDCSSLESLDISGNSITRLPEELFELSNLRSLNISGNRIGSWPPRGVFATHHLDTRVYCGVRPREKRFGWVQLQSLDASGNPLWDSDESSADLGDPIRVFIHSVAYLHRLSVLECRRCGLRGSLPLMPLEGGSIAMDAANTGGNDCEGYRDPTAGLTGLQLLDLADNDIAGIHGSPPPTLLQAILANNNLHHLHRSWYNEAGTNRIIRLQVQGNDRLQAPVLPPVGPCPSAGAGNLIADPSAYRPDAQMGYECTGLCPGLLTRFSVDADLNVSALCRCLPGHSGQGRNCTGCPFNSSSAARDPNDQFALVRECRSCPALARTLQSNRTDRSQCLCPRGHYLSTAESQSASKTTVGMGNASGDVCRQCDDWPFRTTEAEGALSAVECRCNDGEYTGLKAVLGVCGCDDGFFMDHASKRCKRCSKAELCVWSTRIQKSLEPPAVKPGFWAEPVPSDLTAFAGNKVWRCFSDVSCGEDGCADGRGGRACSLCVAGRYGSPDKPCKACPGPPEAQRWLLAMCVIVATPLPFMLHCVLAAKMEDRGFLLTFRAFRRSGKQMVKQMQTITVIGGFSVDWPLMAKAVFDALKSLTVTLPSLAGAGCLQQQTSALLEMSFKWGIPPAFVVATLLAVPLSWVVALLSRRFAGTRVVRLLPVSPADVPIGFWGALRVMLFTAILFNTSLVTFFMELLTCSPSPDGTLTVVTYPHIECSVSDGEFAQLFPIAAALSASYIIGMSVIMFRGNRDCLRHMAASNRQDRGWYGFIFDDFRDEHVRWAVGLMAKDVLLVSVALALPGQGAAQLLVTATVLIGIAALVMRDSPFQDWSNTLLEAWNNVLAAGVCLYSAGMGFSEAPSMDDITELFQDGEEDPAYRVRAVGMVVMQTLTLAVPVAVMGYQLLGASPRSSWLLPRCLRPVTREQEEQWIARLKDPLARDDLIDTIEAFDSVEFRTFRGLIDNSPATMGRQTLSRNSSSRLTRLSTRSLTQDTFSTRSFTQDTLQGEGGNNEDGQEQSDEISAGNPEKGAEDEQGESDELRARNPEQEKEDHEGSTGPQPSQVEERATEGGEVFSKVKVSL